MIFIFGTITVVFASRADRQRYTGSCVREADLYSRVTKVMDRQFVKDYLIDGIVDGGCELPDRNVLGFSLQSADLQKYVFVI